MAGSPFPYDALAVRYAHAVCAMADEVPRDDLNADRLEEDWEHALDAADEALNASTRSRSLGPQEVAAGADHVREERTWFRKFRPALRRLFPRQHSPQ